MRNIMLQIGECVVEIDEWGNVSESVGGMVEEDSYYMHWREETSIKLSSEEESYE